MEKAVVILSGGMDSTTLLYQINKTHDTYAISFDYNQKHKKELEAAKATCEQLGIKHKVLDVSLLNEVAPSALTRDDIDVPEGHYEQDNMKQTVVPNRNMVFVSLATSYAISIGAKQLFYGAHAGDHAIYPDCRKEFVDELRNAVKLCDWSEVELSAPFVDIDKGDIAIKGKELEVDYSLTWTCYKGQDKPCGKCGACVERAEAFEKAGMKDPLSKEE
ncbi:MAG: putative 7-cyano-7-deazaguanine synthase [Prokaryotic dsDNA virus sp.]|jgi:7-cyano-7-deazaguanine synthase|nr:MAG: putative 7-cyano-7-deazaguanine synthase [Prokaryotic dsDNA virus sp.]|tara:strand:+ start:4930 stop:5583 length:654 start_codon:yes stop_codon:yes gene_type:complete